MLGARNRNRTGTPAINEAADFKSAVSTNFTTRAPIDYILVIIVLYSFLGYAVQGQLIQQSKLLRRLLLCPHQDHWRLVIFPIHLFQ